MQNKRITYSLPVLKTLLSSKSSCVYCFENCKRCFFTNPLQIGNIKVAVTEHLKSKVTTYDSELQGIILSHKNIKVVNYVQLSDEGEYSLDYIADIYIFKPTEGNILTGKANKKGQDHLGVLVHSVFNATLPRPRYDEECPKTWVGASVKIGEEVTFEVVKVNLLSRLPYIRGKLISVEERDTEDGDSGIGGHESTEESPSNAFGPFSSSDVDCDVNVNETKKKQKGKRKSSILNLQSSLLNEILVSPSSSDHSENKNKEDTPVEYDSPKVKKYAMKLVKDRSLSTYENISNAKENNIKSKKRKSSLLDIEKSMLKYAFERLSSPELCSQDASKVKKRKISNTSDDEVVKQEDDFKNLNFAESSSKGEVMDSSVSVTNMESTINNLINSQINSFTPKKKKLSKELHTKNETDSNEMSQNCLSIASSERMKKKSLDKEQTEQKIENTNDISLSEQSQYLLQLAEQGNILSETSPKKRKKKKSKESFLLENSEKADEIMNSSEDSIQSVKKKKKSVSFQNPVISTVNNSGFGVSTEQLPMQQESILNIQQNLDTPVNFLESKKKKKKSVTCEEKERNLSYLSNTGPESSQIQNHIDGMEEETNIKRDKKKKKKKSSLLPETEKCLLDISYIEPLNEDIQVDSVEKDSSIYNKEHKKKKKSITTLETEENLSMVNYSEENKQIQNIYNELEQNSDHKKKKKKRSLIQEENFTDSSLYNQIEPDISFSEMPPPSATKVKKRKFSEVETLEVETDSFNEITQVKKKKKKSRDIS